MDQRGPLETQSGCLMQRRKRWLVLTCGATVLLIGAGLAYYSQTYWPHRLHIILVTLDTTRADRIGCYGYSPAKTPALDALAREGVLFERTYTPVPLTLPSHASLFTGLYPPEHGLLINGRGRLADQIPVLAEMLRDANYDTAAFVSSFVLDSKFGLERGFQTYDDDLSGAGPVHDSSHRRRPGDEVMHAALKWLEARTTRPCFCWIHLFDAHAAYDPRPDVFGDAFLEQPYDAGVAYADRQLQKLLDLLRTHKWAARSLVVVVGDHGEGLMDHHEESHSLQIYDATMRVPMVIAGPAVHKPGHRVLSPVSLVDLLPTILDCAGLPERRNLSGRRLTPALAGQALEERACYVATDAPFVLEGWAPLHGVVTQNWKYIHTVRPELYDLSVDPQESHNLADAQPARLRELADVLQEIESRMQSRQALDVKLSAQEQKTLESLGYAAGRGSAMSAESTEHLPDVKDMIVHHNRIESARLLLGEGQLLEAVNAAGSVLEQRPHYASARMLLGDAQMLQMKYPAAAETYKTALTDRPQDPFLHARLGSALAAQEQDQGALDEYRQALEIDPGFAQCHLDLAQVLLRLGNLVEGTRELEEAIHCDPALLEAHMQLGRLMSRTGRSREATAHYDTVLKLDPTHTIARLNLASALSNQGRVVEAAAQARKASELDPQSFDAKFHLASILLLQNRPDEAIVTLREALKLRPEDRKARELLENVLAAKLNGSG